MALLSKFKDVVRGVTLSGVTTTTVAHGLLVAPDRTSIDLRSMASASANSSVIPFGANATFATVQCVPPSAAPAQVVAFDVWNDFFMSMTR
jgi:hypothetical protein